MTDKNGGHNGAQWTKATAAALLAAQQKQPTHHPAAMGPAHQQQQSLYSPSAHLMPAHTPLLAHPDGIAPYASARFHPPMPPQTLAHHPATIQHASAHQQPPLTHAPTTVLTAPSSASPNVPAQSGFVPPPLLPTAVAAATSVLTPNPFAVTEQLSHLNTQQQLNKIMSAMQQHASSVASANTSNAAVVAPHAQPVRQHVVDLPMSSGSSGSAAGSVSGNTAAGGAAVAGTSSGAINSTIAENVLNAISAAPNNSLSASVPAVHGRLMGIGVKVPDDDKLRRIQHVVESGVSELAKQQILQILDRISTLKPVEKLLLYLRLPGDAPETDPLRHPQNPLGTRSEINHTINWVRSHLEHDPKVSIPKQDVYNDYLAYCDRLDIKPLSTADFGKVMKQVFPGIRPRRLGTRGHSRYCYAAMRKTTKLTSPQLPQIDSASVAQANESSGSGNVNDASMLTHTDDIESWQVIREWAEHMLHTKVDTVQELAARIKDAGGVAGSSGGVGAAIASTTAAHGRSAAANLTHHKKYTPREPKEKRHLVDMGPLKKRRKKKRKGSSSSESSCSQPLQPTPLNASQSQVSSGGNNNNSNYPDLSHIRSGSLYTTEDKPNELIQVKQEVLESPNIQHAQPMPGPTRMQSDSYLQQQLPMNLVTEQRTVLARAPPAASAFGVVQPQRVTFPTGSSSVGAAAVKNLTPKIIEMSTAAAATPVASAVAMVADQVATIKEEEFTDEYNPNILCKKVRKAQQTKGQWWANSPTAPSNVVPIITTTPASATPPAATVASTPLMAAPQATATNTAVTPAATPPAAVGVVSPSFLMGPPAQIGSGNTSISPSNALLSDAASPAAASPKVASRNMMQLRAKRLQLAAAAAAAATNVDTASGSAGGGLPDADAADLPSNLGLPRERVISICNMDKHELDDYLMTAEEEEEEDQEDQETELLQYFQTGDAEEKLNSLDAAKNRNPTATTTVTTTLTSTAQQAKALAVALPQIPAQLQTPPNAVNSANKAPKDNGLLNTTECFVPAVAVSTTTVSQLSTVSYATAGTNSAATTMTPAVGSASASLALMSQKHQQQHHRQRPNLTQLPRNANGNNSGNNNKRKINLSGTAVNPADVMVPRKNCFLPISPNINSGSNNSTGTVTASGIGASNNSGVNNFFISPGQGTQRVRPKATFFFNKQLSLENYSSDPMIGAIRRRRSYANLISNSTGGFMPTSASAPPSPSLLHQQQQQQLYNNATHFMGGGNTCLQEPISTAGGYNDIGSNSSTALLTADQNSLDLDLFGAAATAASTGMDYDELTLDELTTPLNETQRSQSVPLSQLQRIHSPTFNRSSQVAPYSACTSVAQTPVPHEFADSSTLFSENSSSQNSGGGAVLVNTNATLSGGDTSAAPKLDEADVLASDSSAIFDSIYVSDILPEDFVTKFPPANTTTTTCSSAGSSSGYSTTTFGSTALMSGGGGGTITSRSVPSTPLPHQQQQSPFSNFYGGRRRLDDDTHLSPLTAAGSTTFTTASFKYGNNGGYDMSRSMPTTPITTPHFRYSPTEFSRDFLSNGNTIDSLISGGASGANGDVSVSDGLNVALASLNATDALIDDSCGLSADAFGTNAVTDTESMIADADLLGNL